MRRILLAAVLVVAGCSNPPAGAPADPPTTTSAAPAGTALYAVASRTLENIVIDTQGFVLYRSDRDSASPTRSACAGSCLQSWLPVPCQGEIRVEGIDRQLVACFDRPDGRRQLSLAGWPLYGYSGDRMPGDTNGHGQSDGWFAISPNGERAIYVS
ncbi:hypothetical protein [Micromonospora sp. NBC_01813]|uniref:hypothetical protein n=1 Tax=Micromonospora sp. NBC_01813 TaxID=2975988 RepID=UPI002DD8D885|nr:hypothetical protein [Micromonospora sp. NBC_01813]WSA08080.1 hypothetical protein OG958_28355 [Micromonospora sp. NBC_01813]